MKPSDSRAVTIDFAQMVALLSSRNHAEPIGFSAFTDAMERKTGCPYHAIRKLSQVRPFCGTNYTDAVNRQRIRECNLPDFVAQLPKYEHVSGPLVRYKTTGNLCIAVQFNESAGNRQVSRKPVFLAQAKPDAPWQIVAREKVAQWVDKPASAKFAANVSQDLHKAIHWRTFGLKGIAAFALDGTRYRVRQFSPLGSLALG